MLQLERFVPYKKKKTAGVGMVDNLSDRAFHACNADTVNSCGQYFKIRTLFFRSKQVHCVGHLFVTINDNVLE